MQLQNAILHTCIWSNNKILTFKANFKNHNTVDNRAGSTMTTYVNISCYLMLKCILIK